MQPEVKIETPNALGTDTAPAETKPELAAVPAAPAEEAKKPDPLAPRFAALAKKEKSIRRQAEDMKAQQAKLTEMMERVQKFESASNPIQALMARGYSYQDATEFVLNGEKATPDLMVKELDQKYDSRFKKLEEEKERNAKEAAERSQQEATEALEAFSGECQEFIDKNAEAYELTHIYGRSDLVVQTISAHWERQAKAYQEDPESSPRPKMMSKEEAAGLVEKYLEEEADKVLKTKKFASKMTPKVEEKKETKETAPKTLTNTITSSVPSMLSAKNEEDRLQRAMAALNR